MILIGLSPPTRRPRSHPPTRTLHLSKGLSVFAAALLFASVAGCTASDSHTAASAPVGAATHKSSNPETTPALSPTLGVGGSACGLVTTDEVAAATGKPMGAGAGAGTICSYSATGDPSTVVYIQLYTDKASMGAAKATEPGSEHLSGLGDDAFWTAAGTISVQKGTRGITISTPSRALSSPTAPAAIVTLADNAVGRL